MRSIPCRFLSYRNYFVVDRRYWLGGLLIIIEFNFAKSQQKGERTQKPNLQALRHKSFPSLKHHTNKAPSRTNKKKNYKYNINLLYLIRILLLYTKKHYFYSTASSTKRGTNKPAAINEQPENKCTGRLVGSAFQENRKQTLLTFEEFFWNSYDYLMS